MALNGDRVITVEGQPYRLVLDINAMVLLEEAADKPFHVLLGQCQQGRIGAIRAVIWAALQRHHPDMTVEQAGEWMGKVGLDALAAYIASAAQDAQPDPRDTRELGIKAKRPRKARTAA